MRKPCQHGRSTHAAYIAALDMISTIMHLVLLALGAFAFTLFGVVIVRNDHLSGAEKITRNLFSVALFATGGLALLFA